MTALAVAVSLAGAGLVAFRRAKAGQFLWIFSNAWLSYHNAIAGEKAQAILFLCFGALALWGVIYGE